jgi:hypothetical protein
VWRTLLAAVGDLQLGLLMPVLTARARQSTGSSDDAELDRVARQTFELPEEILRAAQKDGSVRPDISSIDIHLLLATVTRPLAGVSPAYNREVARRNMLIVMDGLAAVHPSQLPTATADAANLARMAELDTIHE